MRCLPKTLPLFLSEKPLGCPADVMNDCSLYSVKIIALLACYRNVAAYFRVTYLIKIGVIVHRVMKRHLALENTAYKAILHSRQVALTMLLDSR